jgi:hypothetical protein
MRLRASSARPNTHDRKRIGARRGIVRVLPAAFAGGAMFKYQKQF